MKRTVEDIDTSALHEVDGVPHYAVWSYSADAGRHVRGLVPVRARDRKRKELGHGASAAMGSDSREAEGSGAVQRFALVGAVALTLAGLWLARASGEAHRHAAQRVVRPDR